MGTDNSQKISDKERLDLIAKIRAVMPTQDDHYLTELEYEEILSQGPPRYIYHATDRKFRERIAEEGLLLRHSETAQLGKEMGEPEWWLLGGIFFSTVIHDISPVEDIWVLDTKGWSWAVTEIGAAPDEIAPDFSVDPACWAKGEIWWYLRCDVPPEKIKLHELCYPCDEENISYLKL